MNRRGFLHLGLVSAAAVAPAVRSGVAVAQAPWPAKPVKLVVPFAPGGGSDIIARLLAPKFVEILKQPLLIDNRPGASGIVGADAVVKSAADGYTLLLSNNASLATAPQVYGNKSYHPLTDFAHIVMIGAFANALLVRADHPANTIQEFLARIKREPGKFTFASAGPGSAGHLTGELLKSRAAIDMQHVPYKGAGPAIVDLLAGHIDAVFDGLPASIGYIRSGKLRMLAISSAQRSPLFPAVPTLAEVIPDVIGTAWFGLSAPARTPPAVVATLQQVVQRMLAMPDLQARYREMGVDIATRGAADYTAFVETEIARWTPVIRAASVKAN